MVYGLTLALYSLPLRQGLLHYSQETLTTLAKNFVAPGRCAELDTLMDRCPMPWKRRWVAAKFSWHRASLRLYPCANGASRAF